MVPALPFMLKFQDINLLLLTRGGGGDWKIIIIIISYCLNYTSMPKVSGFLQKFQFHLPSKEKTLYKLINLDGCKHNYSIHILMIYACTVLLFRYSMHGKVCTLRSLYRRRHHLFLYRYNSHKHRTYNRESSQPSLYLYRHHLNNEIRHKFQLQVTIQGQIVF